MQGKKNVMVNDINGGKRSLYGITPINNPYTTSRHFLLVINQKYLAEK